MGSLHQADRVGRVRGDAARPVRGLGRQAARGFGPKPSQGGLAQRARPRLLRRGGDDAGRRIRREEQEALRAVRGRRVGGPRPPGAAGALLRALRGDQRLGRGAHHDPSRRKRRRGGGRAKVHHLCGSRVAADAPARRPHGPGPAARRPRAGLLQHGRGQGRGHGRGRHQRRRRQSEAVGGGAAGRLWAAPSARVPRPTPVESRALRPPARAIPGTRPKRERRGAAGGGARVSHSPGSA
mmetsp:Transcript_21242/g.47937  ORF Transcript_21242/g.47937 Transcript_21242/m.47937 type:complete len:239 (-) Transcript_21242:884-1600(-)